MMPRPQSILSALAFAGALALAAPALAEDPHGAPPQGETASAHEPGGHGGGHHFNAKAYAFQTLNFAILVFILGKFGVGALNKMLAARREQLQTDLAEAAAARAAAEERLQKQEKRLAGLEQELAALRTRLKQEAEDEKRRLISTAEEKVKRIQNETQFLLDQQVKEAERRFRTEVADAALRIAEAEVRRALQPADEQRLVQSFVSELERAPAERAS